MATIKETQDVIALITTLGVLIGREVSGDGLQLTDVLKLLESSEFRENLEAALDGALLVPVELQDLTISEGFDLSMTALEAFRKILAAFEGGQVA
ncbi:MAG: hypothetical protein HRU19_03250 [Pseudobacteriovorax sp.]|nr:hypothetical protein [Pseudobacteriovorax sp.]